MELWNYELVNPEAMRAAPPVRYPHALPVSWALQTVAKKSPALATKLLKDCLDDFRANGVFEWVNWAVPVPGNRVGHPNYVASVAAVQSFARDHASVKD